METGKGSISAMGRPGTRPRMGCCFNGLRKHVWLVLLIGEIDKVTHQDTNIKISHSSVQLLFQRVATHVIFP